MSILIIGVLGSGFLVFLLWYLFSQKLNQSDESIVIESATANGWTEIAIASKSIEFNNFQFEKITYAFIVDYVDGQGVPRRSTCRVNSGSPTWES